MLGAMRLCAAGATYVAALPEPCLLFKPWAWQQLAVIALCPGCQRHTLHLAVAAALVPARLLIPPFGQ
jgi:hypothetical protein